MIYLYVTELIKRFCDSNKKCSYIKNNDVMTLAEHGIYIINKTTLFHEIIFRYVKTLFFKA